jgi:hypothetical protein
MPGFQGRRRRTVAAPVAAALLVLLSAAAARADDRAEIEALKKQVEALQRSDAEKQRKLDEMMELLRQIAPQAAVVKHKHSFARTKVVATPAADAAAANARRALDDAARDMESAPARPAITTAPPVAPASTVQPAGSAPADSRRALDQAVRGLPSEPRRPADGSSTDAGSAEPTAPLETTADALGVPGSSAVPGTLLYRPLPGQATLRLLEPSVDVMVAGGWSTADDSEIKTLQGGAHDPRRRGFTLQQAELSLYGAVDPYFTAETHIAFFEGGVELEEAFATTQRLPYGLRLEAGYYLTEFGRINPTHLHAWSWVDQPIVNTRMFGGDGLRSAGVQASWLLPLPFFSELWGGVQNANGGEYTTSFLADEGIGGYPAVRTDTRNLGDLLYLVRSATAWNMGDETSALLGFSGLFGPNSTGGPARTFIYGADFTLKWRPADSFRGWPFLLWQTEVMKRDYTAEPFVAGSEIDDEPDDHGHSHGLATARDTEHDHDDDHETGESIPGQLLRDWGFYTQLLYGFRHPWAAGVRVEWASGSGESVPEGRSNDPLRDDRLRVSPLLQYQPSEFSRIRLQYNYDHATALPGEDASTIWLALELLYGGHPAHEW